MSDEREPLAQVRLMDGRTLVVTPSAVRVGDQSYLIAKIGEARLLFLRPETIGLRMADVGLVEYTVARPGDGQVALNAIYHARPELNRPDLDPPAAEAPPGFFVPPPAPANEPAQPLTVAAPPAPLSGVNAPRAYPPAYPPLAPLRSAPPPPAPFPPEVAAAYGAAPNRRYATLTPRPRSAWRLMGATFRLAARRFGALYGLAFLVVFLPNLALGVISLVALALSGQSPFAAAPNPLLQFQQALNGQTPATATAASTSADSIVALLSLVAIIGGLVVDGWSVATLTVAARDVTLGRRVRPLACAREGWRRLWPTLVALAVTTVALLVVAAPGLGVALGMVLAVVDPEKGAPPLTSGDATVILAMAGGLALLAVALLAWLWPRLALAPTAAALGMSRPVLSGWNLARGGAGRILLALLVVGAVTTAISVPATLSQFISNGWAVLLIIPLAQMIVGPLSALVRTLALYDQRLRFEGYQLFQREGVMPPTPAEAAASAPATEGES